MSRKARYIFLMILIVVSIGTIAAYRMANKAPERIEDVKGIPISATELAKAFAADEATANKQYLEKGLAVTGVVSSIERNQEGGSTVILETGDPMLPVVCGMDKKNVKLNAGQTVTISGFCSGNIMGVSLTGCVINKQN